MTSPSFLVPSRDRYFVGGRARRSAANYYFIPGVVLWGVTTGTVSADTDTYVPIIIRTPLIIDQIAIEVTTAVASTFVRCGLYASDKDKMPVGPPLLDSGNIDTSTTGVKTYTPSTPVVLQPGRYLMVWNATGTPTLRRFKGNPSNSGLSATLGANSMTAYHTVSRTNAAFPNPGTAWTGRSNGTEGGYYMFVMRASAA